jgi:type II secretory ATPase GspE/PulE/Tfp pilus assembly ATPase PilB-like protein
MDDEKAEIPPDSSDLSDIGFVELAQLEVDAASVRLLDRELCLAKRIVVLGKVDPGSREPAAVGMVPPVRRSLVREAARLLGRPVRPVPLNDWEIRRAIDLGWGDAGPGVDPGSILLHPVSAFTFAAGIPVPELLDEILGRAVELGASDIHIERYENDVDVRFRVDGVLRQVATALAPDNVPAVLARLKVLAGLDIAEKRRAQDGRIQAVYRGMSQGNRGTARPRAVDFRLSVLPGPFGEDAVLRILDSAAPLSVDRLGFDDEMRTTFERLIASPEGMLLVTGPTGSGKTTTLYAAIHAINTPENKILTAEDPIEYYFPKTNQKQVSDQMSFADYARAFLRQNPDVILIGEVRDEETADAAVRAAQTGHLVLSTLHTTDAVRTISRLRTLGVDSSLIAGCLLGAVSQRLLRRLCEHCRAEAAPDVNEVRRLGLAADAGGFFRAAGCEACAGTGFRGRLGVYELFVPDEELADMIAHGEPAHRLRANARTKGMRTLLDDAFAKARAGLVPLSEILRAVPYRILEGG